MLHITHLKGPFCGPNVLFLWHSSLDIHEISWFIQSNLYMLHLFCGLLSSTLFTVSYCYTGHTMLEFMLTSVTGMRIFRIVPILLLIFRIFWDIFVHFIHFQEHSKSSLSCLQVVIISPNKWIFSISVTFSSRLLLVSGASIKEKNGDEAACGSWDGALTLSLSIHIKNDDTTFVKEFIIA